ncbi:hypothetical protein B0H19DRAFT_1254207 [Mycena capillaripes]|nr:hypothetical protein B0H19DRAFT_1254207 [Mycena capillaripes]
MVSTFSAAATLTVGTLFYGIYSVLFFLSIYLFIHRYNAAHSAADSRKRNPIFKSVVFGSAVLLFVVVTTHWLIIVYRGFLAFGSLERLALGNQPLNEHTLALETAQDSVLSVTILLDDSLIQLENLEGHPNLYSIGGTQPASGFIASKALRRPYSHVPIQRFLVIVVESAAFYAIWTLFFAIAYATKFSLQVLVITTGPAVVGMVNAVIHTRVGLGWASESEQGPGGRPVPSSLRFAMPSSNSAHGENGTTEMSSVRTDQQIV